MSTTNKSDTDDLSPPPSNAGTTTTSVHSFPFSAAIIDDGGNEMPELLSDGDDNDMPDLIPTAGTWDNERDSVVVDRQLSPVMIFIFDGVDQYHRPVVPYLVGHSNEVIDQYFTNHVHNNNNNHNTQQAPPGNH